jgi:predicted anti-sigma-YlaC factor YlaD
MRCHTARESISAELDAAPSVVGREHVAAHLAGCASCRQWQELAHVVTRRARLGGALPPRDLAERLTGGVRADIRRRRVRKYWLAVARAVVGAGLLQLLATVPLLLLARSHTSGGGRVHLLGLVELAIGTGFFVGALVVLWRERDRSVLELVRPARQRSSASAADVCEVA